MASRGYCTGVTNNETLSTLTAGSEIRINGQRTVYTVTKALGHTATLRGARGAVYHLDANVRSGQVFITGRRAGELVESMEVF